MRLTARDINLLKLLRPARWLTTNQIHRRFFPLVTLDAVRKRLRKLTQSGYLRAVRRDRMSAALFAIGPEGKRKLETSGSASFSLERTPPTQIEHFTAINDLRIAAELAGGLKYFYAAWELPGVGWKNCLIPDALLAFGPRIYAMEFDRAVEGVRFFVRSKMPAYQKGFDGLKLTAVLVVADRDSRMMSLAQAIGDQNGRVLFTTLEKLTAHGIFAPVFYAEPGRWGLSLPQNLSSQTIPTTREFGKDKTKGMSDLRPGMSGLLRMEGGK